MDLVIQTCICHLKNDNLKLKQTNKQSSQLVQQLLKIELNLKQVFGSYLGRIVDNIFIIQ